MTMGSRYAPDTSFIISTLIIYFLFFKPCESTATLEIKLKRWQSGCTDDGGLTSNCDPYFRFCVTKTGSNDCQLGWYTCSNHFHNTRVIDFGSNVCGISNPMVRTNIDNFDTNPSLKLTTHVWDADTFSDDHLSTWSFDFKIFPKKDSESAPFNEAYTSGGGHHLWFSHRSYCNAFYHTARCDVYCKAQDTASGHYTCDENSGQKICMQGWTGPSCNQDINECQNSACYNQGSCTNLLGSYQCACLSHFSGKNCDQVISLCHSSPCRNGGTCQGNLTSYNCTCNYMWEGPTCEQQVDTCQSNPCHNAGQCFNTPGNFTCNCSVDWTGELCQLEVNACDSHPCQNSGTCSKLPGATYSCACPLEYEGRDCEKLKDPCGSSPCSNSATCEALSYDTYNCTCVFGWVGQNCSDYLDLCSTNPCQNNATCIWTTENETNNYSCRCTSGWKGVNCSNVMHACTEFSPCQHGANCIDRPEAGYVCDNCPDEFEGKNCSARKDPCVPDPCGNQGKCTEVTFSSYRCTCEFGFHGDTCEFINHCAVSPCQNEANCTSLNGGYTCTCALGWKGANCSDEVDICETDAPCLHGGTCRKVARSNFECDCLPDYRGPRCEDNVSPAAQSATAPAASGGVDAVAIGVGIGCSILLILILLILIFLVRRRRQKDVMKKRRNAPDDLHGIVPVDMGQPNSAFSNAMYDNSRNRILEWQSSRPVPPIPPQTSFPDDFYPVKPGKELEVEGAVGGPPNHYTEVDGYLEPTKAKKLHTEMSGFLDTRTMAGADKSENLYADFADITRGSFVPKSPEENPYQDLDDVVIGTNDSAVRYTHNGLSADHYDNPMRLSPGPPKLPKASHYDLPSTDVPNGSDASEIASVFSSPHGLAGSPADVRASPAFPCHLPDGRAAAGVNNVGKVDPAKSVVNKVSDALAKTSSLYDTLPTERAAAAPDAPDAQEPGQPSPYDRPNSTTEYPFPTFGVISGLNPPHSSPYDKPPSSTTRSPPVDVATAACSLYDVPGCTVTSSSDETNVAPAGGDDDIYSLVARGTTHVQLAGFDGDDYSEDDMTDDVAAQEDIEQLRREVRESRQ